MSLVFNVTEEVSATYEADIVDELDNPIMLSDLTTLKLTLLNQEDNAIINSRNEQDILNANNVVVTSGGHLTWTLQVLDNIIVNPAIQSGQRERHEAIFEWTFDSGTKSGNHIVYIDVLQSAGVGSPELDHYGTISGGTYFFTNRLNADAWVEATDAERLSSLMEATQLIDQLNFKGQKNSTAQFLEFPRSGDNRIPYSITRAAYEIAIRLLDDYDPDIELDNANTIVDKFDKIEMKRSENFVPEHILAGIPSPRAWRFLKPYLRNPLEVKVTRVS